MTGSPQPAALETRALSRGFGGVQALAGLDLTIRAGEIRGVIGPNGAGKTTLLNLLSGLIQPDRGTIHRSGVDISGWPADRVVRQAALARTFQTVRLFTSMTVEENVAVAAGGWAGSGPPIDAWLDRLGLQSQRRRPAAELAFGLQRRVELARALATGARMLLLDEPAAGLNSRERVQLGELLLELREEGVTILLVEHQMDLVADTCELLTVLDFGRVVAEGTHDEVLALPQVIDAFLGTPVPRAPTNPVKGD